MASRSRPSPVDHLAPYETSSTVSKQPFSAVPQEYDFVERPCQDFYCPVTLEILLQPQLTSCCGQHLSLQASNRLQKEGKACPLCNETEWSTVLDKFHRRRICELRVRCPLRGSKCDWVGELKNVEQHAERCSKQAWECQYCGLKCTYGEGERRHWQTCSKFPESCPNGCEVSSVECDLEQHLRTCPLEPVSCEMSEFGCDAVVPRKDLATHMREKELQHLAGMAKLSLHLTRQLKQDLVEKDEMIAQLRQELSEQKQIKDDMKKEMIKLQKKEQECLQADMRREIAEHGEHMKRDMAEVKEQVQQMRNTLPHIALINAGLSTVAKEFTFDDYWKHKSYHTDVQSNPFYSHRHGYKFQLEVTFTGSGANGITSYLHLLPGENDRFLPWPVTVLVRLELQNQDGDTQHWGWNRQVVWTKDERHKVINFYFIKYSDVEKFRLDENCRSVCYKMNNCLKYKLVLIVQID